MRWLIHGIGNVRLRKDVFLRGHPRTVRFPYVCAFCFEEAGEKYGVSPQLLWAIAKTESHFNPSAVNYNRNGSFDYGLMQVNSSWYGELGRERWMRLGDACYNVQVGAWILSQCISDTDTPGRPLAATTEFQKIRGRIREQGLPGPENTSSK